MAISKILHMKDSGNSFHARHLKRALDYVMNPEKTQGGRLVGAINCQADMAFEQMMDTKKQFGKTDKRQGYHIILSFKEDEVESDRAFEITQKFVAEYLARKAADAFMKEKGAEKVTAALNTEFAGRLAEIYYKGVREAIDAFDSGMMYLGTRLQFSKTDLIYCYPL